MSEITKRFLTSVILFIILILSIYSKIILTLFLLLCFYQMTYEFYLLFSKLFKKKKKIIFLSMFLILIINSYLILFVWNSILGNNFDQKIIFYLIICITICSDIGGYTFGKIFKGKKLSKISPNKTYAGAVGSYVLSLIISYLLFKNHLVFDKLIVYILVVSTTSQIGDLIISFLKRNANLKDTSNLLPGHGGLLDRFDGLILAIPVGTFLYYIL